MRSTPDRLRWEVAGDRVHAAPERVDVWRLPHRAHDALGERFAATLSPEETKRANRYLVEHARRNFFLSRGGLRAILARYLGREPREVEFEYGPHGKPALAGSFAASGLRFNVSHSGEVILIAVARARELGIDIERLRADVELENLARRYFSAAESASLLALEPAARPRAFYRCWTRKEAYLKLKGAGLSFPLDRFQVSLRDDEPPALLATEVEGDRAEDIAIVDLSIDRDYEAALVTSRPCPALRYFELSRSP
ncbi:MAG: 4'-phosphopantetheinyl transferase superfamily protein [Planctomycetes bacterium]|nr:4'-phosphopantetheinyl transferase superfamily protein [Planctomycetota bacterium]